MVPKPRQPFGLLGVTHNSFCFTAQMCAHEGIQREPAGSAADVLQTLFLSEMLCTSCPSVKTAFTSSQLEPCAVCICVSNACPRVTESRTRVCTDLRFITQTRPLAAPDKVYMGVLGILGARGPVVLNLQKCFARAAISRFQIRRCERVRRVQNCSKTGSKVLFAILCLY